MTEKHILTSEEISAIVDGFDPIDVEEMEMLAKLPEANVGLSPIKKLKPFAPTFAINP